MAEVLLSQSTNELATKFQRLYPCFRGCPTQSIVLYPTSPEVVFSCKSKMAAGVLKCIGKSNIAAAKPEILLFERKDVLPTKFQRLYPCFRGARLNCAICIITESSFLLQVQDADRKTETPTIFDGTLSTTVVI